MKCVAIFKHRELATEAKLLLKSHGISAQVVVDPLESIAPALSPFNGVGLMVDDRSESESLALLSQPYKKAS